MTAFEVTQFITLIANIIAEFSNEQEMALMAALFTQLGDTLATITVVESASENTLDI